MDGLKLDDLRWEKTSSYNIGSNIGFLDDIIEIDFDYYHKDTKDLLQKSVTIPSTSGYPSLAYQNVGRMTNDGWELNINAKKFVKTRKFTLSAGFNISQNYNEIKEMDQRVLDNVNSSWTATTRGAFQNRIQVGNPLGSIYGFRYKGVYQYTYDWLLNEQIEKGWTTDEFEAAINGMLAEGKTMPVVVEDYGNEGSYRMDSAYTDRTYVINDFSEDGENVLLDIYGEHYAWVRKSEVQSI